MKNIYNIIFLFIFLTACASSKKAPAPTPAPKTDTKEKPVVSSTMPSINGKWVFESSSEKKFEKIDLENLLELNFSEIDRKVTGLIGCNSLSGFFFTTGNQFNFSHLAITKKKSCAVKAVDQYVSTFFKNVGFYKTNGSKLYLIDKLDQEKYIVFTK